MRCAVERRGENRRTAPAGAPGWTPALIRLETRARAVLDVRAAECTVWLCGLQPDRDLCRDLDPIDLVRDLVHDLRRSPPLAVWPLDVCPPPSLSFELGECRDDHREDSHVHEPCVELADVGADETTEAVPQLKGVELQKFSQD